MTDLRTTLGLKTLEEMNKELKNSISSINDLTKQVSAIQMENMKMKALLSVFKEQFKDGGNDVWVEMINSLEIDLK